MRRILIIIAALALAGCKEANTGLDKSLFNTTSEKCLNYLSSSLKSPSSLKVGEINISTNIPKAEDVSNVFGDLVIESGKIKDSIKARKVRFRELTIDIDYEAKNPFGVSLKGEYQCKYMFSLDEDEATPQSLNTYLYKLISDGEEIDLGFNIPIDKFSGSNLYLNSAIKRVIGANDSNFNESDMGIYKEIESQYELIHQQKEAERLRESWNKNLKTEFAPANLSGID